MRKILIVKELQSPARDLPAGVVLTVGVSLDATVADELVRDEYAVEHEESEAADPKPTAPKPLSQMNKPELQALATLLEVSTDGTVAELRERIVAAQEAAKGGDG